MWECRLTTHTSRADTHVPALFPNDRCQRLDQRGFVPTLEKRSSERARQVKFLLLAVFSLFASKCTPDSPLIPEKGGGNVLQPVKMVIVFTSNEKTAPAWANKTIFHMSARVWKCNKNKSLDSGQKVDCKRVLFWCIGGQWKPTRLWSGIIN